MQTHVKVLAILLLVFGGFFVACGLFLMMIAGGAAGIVGVSGDPDALAAIPIIGMVGSFLMTFLFVLGVPKLIAGVGLLKYKPWARVLTIVLCAISLINFPMGTLLGAYGLWVMLNSETESLFKATDSRPAPTV
jgi:hypothetical protein